MTLTSRKENVPVSHVRVLVLFLVLCLSIPLQALPAHLDKERVWVFVVGVLKFENHDLASWSTKNRRDSQLVEYFILQGVNRDHIVYLADEQATKPEIHKRLASLLKRSHAGDSLFLYYTGHGGNEESGVGTFSTYDKGNWWNQDDLVNSIQQNFLGNRAFLLADCCESGRLAEAVKRVKQRRIAYAVLTSSSRHESGNGHWTFSQAVLDALRGNATLDADGNGVISLQEMADYLRDEMAAMEQTRSEFHADPGWAGKTPIATASPNGPLMRRVMVAYEGEQYRAKMVERKGDKVRIRWMELGYDLPEQDDWVAAASVSPLALRNTLKAGQKVSIESEGSWYPGCVLQVDRGLCRVRYDDYPSSWDCWVAEERLKTLEGKIK